MRDVGLRLEDRAHQRRQARVEADHLLELVEDERDAAAALGRELRRQLEQPLERRVHVLARVARREAEPERAGVRLDRQHRADAQSAEDLGGAVAHPVERRRHLLVQRLRELRRELLLRRRPHQVDLGDEHLVPADELLRGPPDERRLAVAARREDDDVLAVADVRLELPQLRLAVGEALVEGEVAEVERVDGRVFGHCDSQSCESQFSESIRSRGCESVQRQPGEPAADRGRELEAVAGAGRADDDAAAPLEHERLVGGAGVDARLRTDRLRIGIRAGARAPTRRSARRSPRRARRRRPDRSPSRRGARPPSARARDRAARTSRGRASPRSARRPTATPARRGGSTRSSRA